MALTLSSLRVLDCVSDETDMYQKYIPVNDKIYRRMSF